MSDGSLSDCEDRFQKAAYLDQVLSPLFTLHPVPLQELLLRKVARKCWDSEVYRTVNEV